MSMSVLRLEDRTTRAWRAALIGRRTTFADSSDDFSGDLLEREDAVGQSGVRHESRHSPHDGRGLVLHDDLALPFRDDLASAQPVLTHPGEDHREYARAAGLDHRLE